MPSLKQKALHSITRSHYILSLKRRFCFWYSTAQKLDTDHKINELMNVMAEMHKLGENSEALKSPGAFLSWKPLQNNPNSIAQILNRQRFSRFAKPHARTLIRLCKAIGLKLTGYTHPLSYTRFDPTVPNPTPMQATPVHFMGLGKDLLGLIYQKLEDKDVGRFNQANQDAYRASKQERDDRALAKLFPWVAHSTKLEEVKDRLMKNPALLFKARNQRTLFQVALASGSVEMSKMIRACFTHPEVLKRLNITLQKAEALRDAQFSEQFPQNTAMEKMFRLEPTFEFGPFINALTNATNEQVRALLDFDWVAGGPLPDNDLTRELQRFWTHFQEHSLKLEGLLFPYGDYLKAETEFGAHTREWGDNRGIRMLCFAQFILGGLQRRADPTFARVLRQGLFHFLSQHCVTPSCAVNWEQQDAEFNAARSTPNQGLGYTSFCDVSGSIVNVTTLNFVTPLSESLMSWCMTDLASPADHSRDATLTGLFNQTMEGLMACGPQAERVAEAEPEPQRLGM